LIRENEYELSDLEPDVLNKAVMSWQKQYKVTEEITGMFSENEVLTIVFQLNKVPTIILDRYGALEVEIYDAAIFNSLREICT
jgi:hypothetical protein